MKNEKSGAFLSSINYQKINKIKTHFKGKKNAERHRFILRSHINYIEDIRKKA